MGLCLFQHSFLHIGFNCNLINMDYSAIKCFDFHYSELICFKLDTFNVLCQLHSHDWKCLISFVQFLSYVLGCLPKTVFTLLSSNLINGCVHISTQFEEVAKHLDLESTQFYWLLQALADHLPSNISDKQEAASTC